MNRTHIIVSFLIVLIVIAVFLLARSSTFQDSASISLSFKLDESEEATSRIDEIKEVKVSAENTFTHQNPNFSFQIPEGFTVGQIDEAAGKSIFVQNINTGLGFQVFVSPFNENINVLTEERIRKDLPALVIEKSQKIQINGSEGVAFVSQNQAFGRSREIWFVYNNFLYQMSTYIESEALLQKVLDTFEINS